LGFAMRKQLSAAILLLTLPPIATADFGVGWRGNWTGLWPDATPPLEWHRLPKGVLADLQARADRPDKGVAGLPVRDGLLTDWLVLGPFPVADSVKDFDHDPPLDEAAIQPAAGDRVGALVWRHVAVPPEDPFAFGNVHLPWLDLAAAVGGYKRNQLAYANTYLHAFRGGTVRAVVEHAHGLKAWLNGKEVYRSPERGMVLGNYVNLSRQELGHATTPSPRFDLDLRPGWNRLLFKISTYNKEGWTEQRLCLRLMDLPGIPYRSKNILWMSELPGRSSSTPVVVADRLFVMAEPDELLCLDRATGRVLWSAALSFYEALPAAERRANPAYKERVEPLLARLKAEKDFAHSEGLRAKIQEALRGIDKARFAPELNDHFEAHFGIVGYTTPTPVSDGKHVWAWCGNGVAACYDLDGRRQWITRVDAGPLSYASSPALADGVLAVFLNRLIGLDARTGKVCWQQKRVQHNIGAVIPARLAGTDVFVCQRGAVVRAADGRILYRPEGETSGDTGSWGPPLVLGETVYQPKYGVTELRVLDFSGARGDEWKPKADVLHLPEEVSRGPKGRWIDRSTAGSPLVHDGLAYSVDIYGMFYVVDLKARKMLYSRQLDLNGLFHYNAVPVAASLALVGKHLLVEDNQGTTLVLGPGRSFREVARNRIATQLDRRWPIPAQETLTYAPPVAAGGRLYLRGERYLYCVGEK
jgi:outer membrane protein assembly factor BamB